MAGLWITFIVVGALLVAGGIFIKPIGRAAIRLFYRRPDAQEPSNLSWGLRSVFMIVAGLVVIGVSVSQLAAIAGDVPTPAEVESDRCEDLVDQMGSPNSAKEVEEAVAEAAAVAGYQVERSDSTTDEIVTIPSGEETVTILVSTWTVKDGVDVVSTFTWTESDVNQGQGRFSAGDCD